MEPEDQFNGPGVLKKALETQTTLTPQHYGEIVGFVWTHDKDPMNSNLKHMYPTKRLDAENYKYASEQSKVSLSPPSPYACVCVRDRQGISNTPVSI